MIVNNYFAILRNLRNLCESDIDDYHMQKVCMALTDEKAIRKSRVLPFRFLSAWDAIMEKPNRQVALALSAATDIAVDNVPALDGKTLVAVDGSGSMASRWGNKNQTGPLPISIAGLFASAVYKKMDADVILFDDKVVRAKLNPANPVLTNSKLISDRATAGSTDFHLIFETADKAYDRIVIFSDMQAWVPQYNWGYRRTVSVSESFMLYKKRYSADPHVYCFDLQGYGTSQFPETKVSQLYGWSDKVFDYMRLSERGSDAIVDAVKAVIL